MTTEQRRKAISDAVAVAACNPLVPAAVRVGLAAMAEELHDLRAELDTVFMELREQRARVNGVISEVFKNG